MAKAETRYKVIADNRQARYNFEIGQVFEAGIVLKGTEVKSLRNGKSTIGESYASVEGSEVFLINAYIPEYLQANQFNHETKRPRKLLLKRTEIGRIVKSIQREGMTVVPLKMFFNDKGKAKVEIALAKGKKLHDKRDTEKKRDWDREKSRILRDRG